MKGTFLLFKASLAGPSWSRKPQLWIKVSRDAPVKALVIPCGFIRAGFKGRSSNGTANQSGTTDYPSLRKAGFFISEKGQKVLYLKSN